MTPRTATFVPASVAAEQARLHPAAALPALTHQSMPVPVRGGRGSMQMLFFYSRAEAIDPANGVQLWPPRYFATINLASGRFDELRAIKPGDFGRRDVPDKPLGRLHAERNDPDLLGRQVRWLQACDIVLPFFAARTYGLDHDQQRAAHDFVDLTPHVLEAPLLPYFQHAAREFFDWLKLVKR